MVLRTGGPILLRADTETKNSAVVRRHLGYAHIPQRFAAELNALCQTHLNPYLNWSWS
jgi:hypothetical protein